MKIVYDPKSKIIFR